MRRPTIILVLLLLVLASAGCNSILSRTMPPEKIPMDRGNYMDAVSTSWKEQLLTNLVKIRYGDTLTCLEMTTVNTAYELDATAAVGNTQSWHPVGTGVGFRNVLAFGGSIGYQDKPTITYVPLKGDALMKTMVQPLPLSQILTSLQTGWKPNFVFSCCVKSINELQNPLDDQFIKLAKLFEDLIYQGIIRIAVPEPVEPKVTKVPKEYTITLKDERKRPKCEPENQPALQAATPPKKVKKDGEAADQTKEEEDTSIGFLVLDMSRANPEDLVNIKELKKLLWPNLSSVEIKLSGLYNSYCYGCHGPKGSTEPRSILSYLRFGDDNDPSVWMDNADQTIKEAVTSGHGRMAKIPMEPSELRAIIAYITHAPGNYQLYKIYDANQELPLDPNCEKIAMQTRSIYQVLIHLSNFIHVPDADIVKAGPGKFKRGAASGSVYEIPDSLTGFEVKSQKESPPKDAFVAVHYHGHWFYIEDNNNDAKGVLSNTAGILSMSETAPPAAGAPTLTLPVQ